MKQQIAIIGVGLAIAAGVAYAELKPNNPTTPSQTTTSNPSESSNPAPSTKLLFKKHLHLNQFKQRNLN